MTTALMGSEQFTAIEHALWRVTGALARRGYVAAPDEASDLIHDFFLEVWPRVQASYEPSKGPLTAYAAGAFYRYGRRKLAELNATRHRLVDLEEIAELSSDASTPEEIATKNQEIELVRVALSNLSGLQRQVLTEFLEQQQDTAAVARRYGITRYAYRSLLVEALGRAATQIARAVAQDGDSEVLRMLWSDGRTPQQAARLLNRDTSELQTIKRRYAQRLITSIRGKRSNTSKENQMSLTDLMYRAMERPGDEAALRALKARAAEYWSQRQRSEEQEDSAFRFKRAEELARHVPQEWVAKVYNSLVPVENDDPGLLEQVIQRITENEEREIGDAVTTLVSRLPEQLHPSRWFTQAKLPRDAVEEISRDETARYATGDALYLLRYGITPRSIAESLAGFSTVLMQALRFGRAAVGDESPRIEAVGKVGTRLVPRGLMYGQVEMAEVPPSSVVPLADWLLSIAAARPYLIDGFRCEEYHWGLRFIQLERGSPLDDGLSAPGELIGRWSRVR